MKKTARLENWYRIQGILIGQVYGHPAFEDGKAICTSTIMKFGEDGTSAETVNTVYNLGKKLEGIRNESLEDQE
jgi:hypothetical protein